MKITLTKDESHKGYYKDQDGNLYVFRFGGRPIRVDDYRDDLPNENFNNKTVKVEKTEVIDHRKTAPIGQNEKFIEAAETEFKQREKKIKDSKNISDAEKNNLESKQRDLAEEINKTEKRSEETRKEFVLDKDVPDKAWTPELAKQTAKEELSRIRQFNPEYNEDDFSKTAEHDTRVFNEISKFYGYDKLSDDEIRQTLDFAEERGLYHSKEDIAAMRRHLDAKDNALKNKQLEADKAIKKYQSLKTDYDAAHDKYFNAPFDSSERKQYYEEYEKIRDKYNEARDTAISKFSDTIPYKELFANGAKIANVKTNFSEPEVEIRNGQGYVKYQSDDIKEQCGPFGKVLRDCRLTQFNSSITFNDKTGEPYYWGSMDLSYQHNDGGSNGMKVMDYVYSKSKGLEITDTQGNFYKNGKQLKTATELADWYIDHGYSREAALEIANKKISERKN